ncbi:DUF1456 family protein [Bacillus sp. 2205SS5-2]|uniref:DUF1456 family protein n=1 Tax=Bacillus sp. 2205SS5-2 TaxID=3109031 RepID=UPI003FA5D4B7
MELGNELGGNKLNNKDRLIRLRYALDIKNTDMVEIFKLGGIDVTKEEVLEILKKSNKSDDNDDDFYEDETLNDRMLESFFNGFIIFKRGRQEPKPGQSDKPVMLYVNESINNIMLKKLKIALSLTSDDMLDILEDAGVFIRNGELGALLRRVGHKNYQECGDRYARNFLKGLAIKYRG